MKRIFLLLVLVLSTTVSYGQKYSGNFSIGYPIIVGGEISISNGVAYNNNYIGGAIEAGVDCFVDVRTWGAVYLDYRHDFFVSNKSALYLQLAPGYSYSSVDYVLESIFGDEDVTAKESSFYGKIGAGNRFRFKQDGLSMGIGAQCAYFSPSSSLDFVPSVQFTVYW